MLSTFREFKDETVECVRFDDLDHLKLSLVFSLCYQNNLASMQEKIEIDNNVDTTQSVHNRTIIHNPKPAGKMWPGDLKSTVRISARFADLDGFSKDYLVGTKCDDSFQFSVYRCNADCHLLAAY